MWPLAELAELAKADLMFEFQASTTTPDAY